MPSLLCRGSSLLDGDDLGPFFQKKLNEEKGSESSGGPSHPVRLDLIWVGDDRNVTLWGAGREVFAQEKD